jgi:hypothetical protein
LYLTVKKACVNLKFKFWKADVKESLGEKLICVLTTLHLINLPSRIGSSDVYDVGLKVG